MVSVSDSVSSFSSPRENYTDAYIRGTDAHVCGLKCARLPQNRPPKILIQEDRRGEVMQRNASSFIFTVFRISIPREFFSDENFHPARTHNCLPYIQGVYIIIHTYIKFSYFLFKCIIYRLRKELFIELECDKSGSWIKNCYVIRRGY